MQNKLIQNEKIKIINSGKEVTSQIEHRPLHH
jgi:hypothetical protein